MDKIENVKILELEKPRFVRPKEVTFVQNGVSRRWEMVNIHNAVFGMASYKNFFDFLDQNFCKNRMAYSKFSNHNF